MTKEKTEPLREGLHIAFKREWSDSAKRTLAAFANTDGGTIYVGIDDTGQVTGLANPDETMRQVTQAAANAIRPDIIAFLSVTTETMNGQQIVQAQVSRGTDRPYYLSDKGLRPAGVYIRSGAASIPASETAILDMVRETSGNSFEDAVSLEQRLSFNALRNMFEKHDVPLNDNSYRTLGIINADGLYTNLAWLLSDECTASVKAAKFQGTRKMTISNRYEFTGSLFIQLEQILQFLGPYNRVSSTIGSIYREDFYDYPPATLREAVLNLLIHRDYTYHDSALISVYDDRIEFINFGGLRKGVGKDDIINGLSSKRNPKLANIFYRLHLVEAYGMGIPKIFEMYEGFEKQPTISIASHSFKLILPSQRYEGDETETSAIKDKPISKPPTILDDDFANRTNLILTYLQEHPSINRSQTAELTGLSKPAASRLLSSLVDNQTLKRLGKGPSTKYATRRAKTAYTGPQAAARTRGTFR
ncbi:putative DNA binding domain-containing protein [Bifidobacterium sp. ESL0775]|uniref:RNA-binding domain-containing protein n=1 Tax=Bifidobacterium sp. ESL0775 TaxID=2983230 RepID=UPI0023F9E4ED|nr:RNA-binding domain-containing protein [Bifidobacterium sp. ESL0775]WEV69450.1 putative DNA binding domain-containing protein [Bifidobacterium sp. ESL0775]